MSLPVGTYAAQLQEWILFLSVVVCTNGLHYPRCTFYYDYLVGNDAVIWAVLYAVVHRGSKGYWIKVDAVLWVLLLTVDTGALSIKTRKEHVLFVSRMRHTDRCVVCGIQTVSMNYRVNEVVCM